MKRFGMTMAGVLLMSCAVWAQTVPPTDAVPGTQKSAQSELAKEFAKQAKENAKVKIQAVQPTSQYFSPLVGQYNLQLNTARSADPFAALQVAPGTWWNDADTATRLSLTKDQQKKMDEIFQQFRLKLIDLNAALAKEELIMTPLIESEKLDETKILPQIDKIAQARAELEKANSRMLLGIRQTLTMEQWSKIQSSPRTYKGSLRLQF
jgi:Spy/CpxP family protein refolding chaperone